MCKCLPHWILKEDLNVAEDLQTKNQIQYEDEKMIWIDYLFDYLIHRFHWFIFLSTLTVIILFVLAEYSPDIFDWIKSKVNR